MRIRVETCLISLIIIFLMLSPVGKIYAKALENVNANYPQITNIPTLYIYTTNSAPITSKEYYITGTLVAVSSDSKEEHLGSGSGVDIEIRGRGNSTWGMVKKPYRIKFTSKTNFLNLPAKAKSWTLLANYADKSLIRNAVAFKISELVGLEFSPAAKFVDVVLNGEYIGNYMVSDQVNVDQKRVEVEEQSPAEFALPAISGGYLLEIDGFANSEPLWFTTGRGLKITIKYPDDKEINQAQKSYIINFTQRFENALFSSDFKDPQLGYRALVDTASLVNWYIGSELSGNSDSFWSTYIYKRRNIDKFFFGPMWDYDIAFNNDYRLGDATQKLMREHAHEPKTWIQQLWKDEWFRGAVYRRWMELIEEEKIIDKLTAYINETAMLIDESQKKNYQKWGKLNSRVYLEQNLFNTFTEYITYLKKYLNRRAEFLTQRFTSDKPAEPSQPFVADNYYYLIVNAGSNNAIQVQNQSNDINAKLELWMPQSGNNYQKWEIRPVDNNKFLIVNRNTGMAITGNGKGNNLIQATPDAGDSSQLWEIIPVNTGNIYGIVNTKSGYSINNSGGSTANGTATIEWDNRIGESLNQQWYFRKTEEMFTSIILNDKENTVRAYIHDNLLTINYLKGQNRMSIYSLTGQLIYSSVIRNSQFNYQLKPGCYIISVSGDSNYRSIIEVK